MSHQTQLPPPPVQMLQLITGFWTSCCIYAAAKLNIADLLAEKPQTAEQLAAATQTHAPSLYRVLRALASIGIFSKNADGVFSITPLGGTLQSNVPGSMKAMALAQLGDHYKAWGNLLYSVKTGNIAFDDAEGMNVWEYYHSHPEEGVNFMHAMTAMTGSAIMNILPAYDFSGFKTLVDVGGGNGALMMAVLGAAQTAKGIVFDEAYVVAETQKAIIAKGFEGRCEVAAGSFFESVPAGADAYLMKMVLHDWNDEKCGIILKNCTNAMKDNSKLLVIEAVIPTDDSPHPGKFLDINMLNMTGGKERTEEEFKALFSAAGLTVSRVVHTHSPMFSIIEGVKV
ncbi:MAG TPA: methyltransferase [Chitinophagaceae bacterium]|nr:methyltransferase [Chitinophagaceae bacterium]